MLYQETAQEGTEREPDIDRGDRDAERPAGGPVAFRREGSACVGQLPGLVILNSDPTAYRLTTSLPEAVLRCISGPLLPGSG